MFSKKQRRHRVVDTLVGASTKLNGDLNFEGGCHIDGTVEGSVSADVGINTVLSVSEDGIIEGGVTVPYVVLHGIVRGDVYANQRVELGPTARVIGNVYYNLIEMAIGAEINGKLLACEEGRQAEAERVRECGEAVGASPPRRSACRA